MRGVPLLLGLLAASLVVPLLAPAGQAITTMAQPGEPPVAWVIPYPVTAPLADGDKAVYIVARDSPAASPSLRSYSAAGLVQWSTVLAGTAFSDLALGSGNVLLRDAAGTVHAYALATGQPAWSQSVGALPAGFLDTAPVAWAGRIVVWAPSGGELRLRALDATTGAMLWDSGDSWAAASVRPDLVANNHGVYVASRLDDGGLWQVGHGNGTGARSWTSAGWRPSQASLDVTGQGALYVALVSSTPGPSTTIWRIERRDAATGALVWQAFHSEPNGPCCDLLPAPYADSAQVVVMTPSGSLRFAPDTGTLLGQAASAGQPWSEFRDRLLVRGPSGTLPARLETYSATGEVLSAIHLDPSTMPAGGAYVGRLWAVGNSGLTVVQGLPQRLLDTIPAGAVTVIGYGVLYHHAPVWDVAPGAASLHYDPASRQLTFSPLKALNPLNVEIQRQASDGSWTRMAVIPDPDVGGDGRRTWTATLGGTFRAMANDRLGEFTTYSTLVTVPEAPTTSSAPPSSQAPATGSSATGTSTSAATPAPAPAPVPSASPTSGSGGGGSAGGSATVTYTEAPPPPPAFTATATYTGTSSGYTYTAKPGRLVIDTPTAGSRLSGEATLQGRMVDPEFLGMPVLIHGYATWGSQSWPFGQTTVTTDGHWELVWNTTSTPDGHHLLPDGGYRIAIEGAGSRVEASYTLANGQWLRTATANVTFEGPKEGPVWVNATWHGSSGFPPGGARMILTGTAENVAVPLTLVVTPGPDGTTEVSFVASVQVHPVEHEPLDVQFEVESLAGGYVTHGLARRPEPGTVVTSRAAGSLPWAAPAAAAGLATAGLAAAVVASTEAGRFWFLRLAPFALFSRIRGPEAKQHHRREQLLLLVEGRPGISFRELGREAGLKGGVLTHHILTLEREGLVRRHRVGARLQFHPIGPVPAPAPVRQLPALQATLLRLVQASPNVSQSEAARRLGVTRQALHYHVANLRKAGLLALTPSGRESLLTLAPEASTRVWACPSCYSLMEGPRGRGVACPSCGARPTASAAAG